jgi:hypothetical protein
MLSVKCFILLARPYETLKEYIMSKEKKHADFQQPYRKSSNFNKETKDVELKPDGKGNLVDKNQLSDLKDSDKKKIHDAMENMQHNLEMIPGDARGEEEE